MRQDELPSPEDLMPLSQNLITPHLAIAFNIQTLNSQIPSPFHYNQQPISISNPNSSEFDSPELGSDEPARTLKRPRLVWTPQLHKKFVDAVAYLGIKNAVPKTIMQIMSMDGLTREKVASHLQKYRLYLKRMQGLSSGGPARDSATDRLFATYPIPPNFLHPGHPNFDHSTPYAPVAARNGLLQPRYGQFGSPRNGQFEHGLLNRHNQQVVHNSLGDDFESANGRKALTLFPTGDD